MLCKFSRPLTRPIKNHRATRISNKFLRFYQSMLLFLACEQWHWAIYICMIKQPINCPIVGKLLKCIFQIRRSCNAIKKVNVFINNRFLPDNSLKLCVDELYKNNIFEVKFDLYHMLQKSNQKVLSTE